MIYHLCASGKAKAMANAHRAAFIRLKRSLFDVLATCGVTEACIDDIMMLVRYVKFSGAAPAGWVSARWMHGGFRPKVCTENAELLKIFTPRGAHCQTRHPDLEEFHTWLACPTQYAYKTKGGEGWSSVWSGMHGVQLAWFSEHSPVACVLPDFAAIKREAKAHRETLTDKNLAWKPPAGLRVITEVEWDYLSAKHKRAAERAGKAE